jgi:hypothetical protein
MQKANKHQACCKVAGGFFGWHKVATCRIHKFQAGVQSIDKKRPDLENSIRTKPWIATSMAMFDAVAMRSEIIEFGRIGKVGGPRKITKGCGKRKLSHASQDSGGRIHWIFACNRSGMLRKPNKPSIPFRMP